MRRGCEVGRSRDQEIATVTLVRRMSWCYSSVQALIVRDYLEEQPGQRP
jgi:hypothetical protein